MKKIPVIIMGGTGRMGTTIVRMVRKSDSLELAGVVERQEKLEEAKAIGCPVAHDIETLLTVQPNVVVIDFTAPEASLRTAEAVARHGATHVVGTTGFTPEQRKKLENIATRGAIFWSPNMSIGMNTLFKLLPMITKDLGSGYDIEILEIHHNKKKDSPSGTAMRLGECVASAREWDLEETACYHREGIVGERPAKEIGMQTLRGGDVVGTHTVYFIGVGERIEITHHATSRDNFAAGALRVASWMYGKAAGKLYSMQDMLQ